jgi:hypothetical protein
VTDPPEPTWAEVCASLGPRAVAAAKRSAAEAPPLSAKVRAELAIILRRDRLDGEA